MDNDKSRREKKKEEKKILEFFSPGSLIQKQSFNRRCGSVTGRGGEKLRDFEAPVSVLVSYQ